LDFFQYYDKTLKIPKGNYIHSEAVIAEGQTIQWPKEQWSTKHYTEKYRLSKTNLTSNRWNI
jgi:hypothetical protein